MAEKYEFAKVSLQTLRNDMGIFAGMVASFWNIFDCNNLYKQFRCLKLKLIPGIEGKSVTSSDVVPKKSRKRYGSPTNDVMALDEMKSPLNKKTRAINLEHNKQGRLYMHPCIT